ncbi:uncharacterized protein SPSK_10426 [Sporothrix schenckii 1099-18]|uniref:Uncharacterized protein n=1 Tax=Sporothrix schenckii 1099-18 TaxID=1397361 RepID=A0A0F2MBG9_SPOSC|nr:uncharacterized protein SPSK_10426 [Sporothrix schenckii 1099-18]KJR86972.1 hypothetical protein SPSK_10426 [Sporothrix schenckii 1099-18]
MGGGKVRWRGLWEGRRQERQAKRIDFGAARNCTTTARGQQEDSSGKGRREGRRPGMETTQGYGGQMKPGREPGLTDSFGQPRDFSHLISNQALLELRLGESWELMAGSSVAFTATRGLGAGFRWAILTVRPSPSTG